MAIFCTPHIHGDENLGGAAEDNSQCGSHVKAPASRYARWLPHFGGLALDAIVKLKARSSMDGLSVKRANQRARLVTPSTVSPRS